MRRDPLLAHLIGLPPKTNVLLQVGPVEVEIIGVQPDGTLLPHPGDLRDALAESGLSWKEANRVTRPLRNQQP